MSAKWILNGVLLAMISSHAWAQQPVASPHTAQVKGHAPVVSSVAIIPPLDGEIKVGSVLVGGYVYQDVDLDVERGSLVQWLRDGTPISGATGTSYAVTANDAGKQLSLRVTPKSTDPADPDTGAAVESAAVSVTAPATNTPPNPIGAKNVGDGSAPDGVLRAWQAAVDYCSAMGLRLPTDAELVALYKQYGNLQGGMCTNYGWPVIAGSSRMCGAKMSLYWSSRSFSSNQHYSVNMNTGITSYNPNATALYVVCFPK